MTQKVMIAAAAQCFEFDGEITEVEQDHIVLKGKHGDIYIERKHVVFIQYLNEEENAIPQPAAIYCPWCSVRHVDVGEWETRPHHKHLCLSCKKLFRVEGEQGEYFYGTPDDEPRNIPQKSPQIDAAAKFISKRLKHDPLEKYVPKVVEYNAVPPSQLPDGESPEAFDKRFDPSQQPDPVYGNASAFADDDDLEVARNLSSGKHMWNDTAITNAEDLQKAIKVAMENEEHDFSMGMGDAKYKSPAQTILGMKNANSKKDRSR